jgi:hypothetical protein
MKTIKSVIAGIYFLSTALFLSSCEDFLELSPRDSIPSDKAASDAGTIRAAIIGAYNSLQKYYAADYITLGTMPADNVAYNGTLNEYLQLDQNAVPVDNVITVNVYQSIYQAINSSNAIIASIAEINDPLLSATERDNILGEAYFIRALSYFDLIRGWGGVQIQLKPTDNLDVFKGI